ncbi:YitT family protein [Fictibacillus sp. B-59209]|uniref:YczE/YyaS/YitT family protein n=1 Tax=Fictibacillus sp. B-59209 TaxID=3024873 RepID=UPI002E1B7FA5|nr:YitT family protein [Fictibacillus sp. B-59209]
MTFRKSSFFSLGIIVLTLGISLTILSNSGTSPYDALLVGSFRTIGLTVGSWEIIIALLMIFLNAAASRTRPEYLALLTASITGAGIDFWLFTLEGWLKPVTYFSQFSLLALGMVFIGIGTSLYLQAEFAPIPLDRLMLILQKQAGWTIAVSRLVISVVILSLAFLLHGPIGIGTFLTAFLNGTILSFFMPYAIRLYQT